jgi:hypothetical protein
MVRSETRFLLSAKRTSPFLSAVGGGLIQSTTGSRGVRISGSNAGCTKFQNSVKGTGYPLNSSVIPSLSFTCVTVCHHVSNGLYLKVTFQLTAVYRRHSTASPAQLQTRNAVLQCLPAVSSRPSPGPPTHCNPLQCLPAVSSRPSPGSPTHCNPLQCLPAISSRPSPGPDRKSTRLKSSPVY